MSPPSVGRRALRPSLGAWGTGRHGCPRPDAQGRPATGAGSVPARQPPPLRGIATCSSTWDDLCYASRQKTWLFIAVIVSRFVVAQEAVRESAGAAVVAPTTIAEEVGTPAQQRQARTVAANASVASRSGTASQGAPDRGTVKMVERAIFLHHPYENRERLRSILPRKTGAQALDRVLEQLERSGRIAIEGEAIRWASKTGSPGDKANDALKADDKSILAGTCFEWLEKGKLANETIGEHIVRVSNAHEPGSFTDEDAREFDEDMRRAAKGEYYTHEQVWKEFGP